MGYIAIALVVNNPNGIELSQYIEDYEDIKLQLL